VADVPVGHGLTSATTVVPVSDVLRSRVAELRFSCRTVGDPLASPDHHADLWIAVAAIHVGAHLVTTDRVFEDVPGLTCA
jgi:predicted nucleic acid-binding protein